MKYEMCDFPEKKDNKLNHVGKNKNKSPKFIRCPKCGRRLKPRLYDRKYLSLFGNGPDWYWRIPPHKIKRWWKKKKPLSTKKRER